MKIFALIVFSCLIASSWSAPAQEVFQCRSGDEFIENGCNGCFCLSNNQLVCQISRCTKPKEMERCRTGTSWWNGCNKCWCVNIGTICTKRSCIPNAIE
ncbi:hypothetical protein RN001_015507 [Aquatica leii]|uniref:Pacifastin domain-containing protein n=1 Tax=Aquatica leii TaxID=1421715 RepID=A0AAN7SL90_9COLE|nr:hypothetical protein RN001_015507 [Aquatica leii]